MSSLRLPQTNTIFTRRPYSSGIIDSLLELVKDQTGPSSWVLMSEDTKRFLLLFILQNSPYAAAQFEGDRFKTLTLHDYFESLVSQNQSLLTLQAANPLLFKSLLILTQKLPTTAGTIDLVNIESLLHQIKSAGQEVVVSLKRADEVNLFYFMKGELQEAFFADPDSVSKGGSTEDQFLEYAYSGKPAAPVTVQAYYDVQVRAAEDSDLPWPEWRGGIVEYFLRPRPELVFLAGGESVEKKVIAKSRFSIGRNPECDLAINDTVASRDHAVIRESHGKFTLEDLKSRNGTWVNDKRVSTVTLADGDEIRIGDGRFLFVEKSQEPSKKEQAALEQMDTTVMKLDKALLSKTAEALKPEPVGPTSAAEPKKTGSSVVLGLEMLEGKSPGTRYPLKDKTIIGRTKTDINTNDPKASRHHAVIERKSDGYHFIDLKSTNGSFINDQEVHAQRLVAGDLIKIGDTTFKVVEVEP
ncbi:MAG: FHA domain-containing protein [Nitrospirae bacterium]|nr:FHA domain-containing protein [Nitrospirota bacterium]